METDKYSDYVGILTFLSRAFLILTFLMACFLLWRAILWLRDRMNLDDGAVEDTEDLKDPWEHAISRPAADYYWDAGDYGGDASGLGGMNRREQEELILFAGTGKQQKAIRQRRKAAIARMSQRQREEYLLIHGSRDEQKAVKERSKSSEQAQKKQSDS